MSDCSKHEDRHEECCHKERKFTKAQVRLINEFRRLWEQHDVWTRSTIMSIAFDLPDLNPVIERLLRNPVDFGRVLARFYGQEVGEEFSRLLREHLVIAADIVVAAKAGNNEAVAELERRWFENAAEIAELLARINPFASEKEWREMMFEHLRLVKAEAVAILTGDYSGSIAIYDEIERQTLEMADMMAMEIFMKFPCRFTE